MKLKNNIEGFAEICKAVDGKLTDYGHGHYYCRLNKGFLRYIEPNQSVRFSLGGDRVIPSYLLPLYADMGKVDYFSLEKRDDGTDVYAITDMHSDFYSILRARVSDGEIKELSSATALGDNRTLVEVNKPLQ